VNRMRQVTAEFLGSALLAMIVVGSGIAAQKLSPHQGGLELLENDLCTVAGLYFLISVFSEISGAHFNPIISFTDVLLGKGSLARALYYLPAQVVGCISGTLVANTMFGLKTFELSRHQRFSSPHLLSELIATAGLVLVIFGLMRRGKRSQIASSVAAYVGAGYFFTSSTCFANPAIAVGRMFSNSFAGIAPSSVLPFIFAEVGGAMVAVGIVAFVFPKGEVDE